MKLKIGRWLWTVQPLNCRGGLGLGDDFSSARDFTIAFGTVVFVGEHLVVFRNTIDGQTSEWSMPTYGLFKASAKGVLDFFAKEWEFDWAREIKPRDLNRLRFVWSSLVVCPRHGFYDRDELCWRCAKELRKAHESEAAGLLPVDGDEGWTSLGSPVLEPKD